jgi:ABC-2 family transporter protein
MTALTAPAPLGTPRRPVPWTRLGWVTWRQHRAMLAGVAVLLGGLSLYLLITGLKIRDAYAAVAACRPAGSAGCQQLSQLFDTSYYSAAQTFAGLLQVVPVLIGVFAGAPLLARELETGTFRFAWTQGCGRTRWAVAKLVPLAAALTAAAAAFSLLFSWYYHPFFAEGNDGVLAPQLFDLRGADFAVWTLAAFAIGVFAGVVIRRTVPAMAAALAAWTALDLATVLFLRKHYAPPVTGLVQAGAVKGHIPWVVAQWWQGPAGQHVSPQTIRGLAQQAPAQIQAKTQVKQGADPLIRWLGQHGYTQWMSYQPASRFWHFQLVEGGWLFALALILGAAAIWLVRRRAA